MIEFATLNLFGYTLIIISTKFTIRLANTNVLFTDDTAYETYD